MLTNTKCLLFGVDYNILYIGRADDTVHAQEELHRAIEDLYREIYRLVYGRLCKPYVPEKHSKEGRRFAAGATSAELKAWENKN